MNPFSRRDMFFVVILIVLFALFATACTPLSLQPATRGELKAVEEQTASIFRKILERLPELQDDKMATLEQSLNRLQKEVEALRVAVTALQRVNRSSFSGMFEEPELFEKTVYIGEGDMITLRFPSYVLRGYGRTGRALRLTRDGNLVIVVRAGPLPKGGGRAVVLLESLETYVVNFLPATKQHPASAHLYVGREPDVEGLFCGGVVADDSEERTRSRRRAAEELQQELERHLWPQ